MLKNKREKIVEYFKGLNFNPSTHTYKHKKQKLTSVSSTISKFVEPFDTQRIAGYVAKSRGISKAEVLAEWDEKRITACDKGNRVHDFGELYANSLIEEAELGYGAIDGYERAVCAFWDSIPEHIEPFLMELQMYSPEMGIAGTADILLYNTKTGKFIIADYKTNIDLFKNHRGKRLLHPFQDLLDQPLSKYILQLSYYQLLFEKTGFEVESRRVVWLKPDGTFVMYNTEDLTERIKNTL